MRLIKPLLTAALFALAVLPAKADVVLGGQNWTGTGNVLTLTPVVPGGNQPQNIQCVICGANQPQQAVNFGYTDFQNNGGLSNILEFSTNVSGGGNPGSNVIGIPYDGSFLRSYLVNVGNPQLTFNIGIDVNDNNQAQTLESFYMLNFTTKTVLASFQGPANILSQNNGTGFPDYTLSTLSVVLGQDISVGDQIIFFGRISGANDGPDSFFLVPAVQVSDVPVPAAAWLFASGLGGLYWLQRRRKKTQPIEMQTAS